MIIKLYHRHYGIHSLVKAVEIKGGFFRLLQEKIPTLIIITINT